MTSVSRTTRGNAYRLPAARSVERDTLRFIGLTGCALTLVLTGLAVTSARHSDQPPTVPFIQQMSASTGLFRGGLPTIASLPADHYAVFAAACIAALWFIYLLFAYATRDTVIDSRLVVAGSVLVGIAAMAVPPVFSSDIYSYAIFGRLASVYDLNPHTTTALVGAPDDPVMPYLYWRDIPSPYGPFWTHISWAVTFRHASPLELVLRFKVAALCAVLASARLVYLLVRERNPERAGWAALAFAWNPLIMIEGVVAGHNDIFILTGLLGGAYLLEQRRPCAGIVALTAATLIKYSSVPVLGLASVRLFFRTPASLRPRVILLAASGACALTAAVYLPYWAGVRGLMSTVNEPGRGVNNPLFVGLNALIEPLAGEHFSIVQPTTALALTLLVLTCYASWQLFRAWRQEPGQWSAADELAIWGATLAVLLIVWPRLHTWYFIVPLGLALAAGPRHRRLYLGVMIAGVLSYASYVL